MTKYFFPFALLFLPVLLYAQLVVTDPMVPVTDQPVTITFDATQGSAGLMGYTGDVYAHTGVITEESLLPNDWKYVKSNWGVNIPETKMTRIADDRYTLEITPGIREFYGVPGDEEILQLAFVFRSAAQVGGQWLEGKTETGGDIFVDVVEPGLSVKFIQPKPTPVLLLQGEAFAVEVYAHEATYLEVYVDENLILEADTNYLLDTITAMDEFTRWVKVVAGNAEASVADSFYYVVRPDVNIALLPEGIRDGINYTGDESVLLSLLAPGKEFVYVIGDFNDWNIGNEYFMDMTPDGERFWLEITGLEPGSEYAFQYLIDGEIRVGDPYADKVSDPWNDKNISENTYPGLIEYPFGKTEGIASVLQTAQEPYQWEVDDFVPAKTTDLVIYELLVRDFTGKHTYAAVTDSLDYLARLGVNAIELMPVNEFEGNSSWGYNPSFYFAPDKYYGPKNELKRLIDECHKRGIAVILDMVLNHSYNQSPMVQMYFDETRPTEDNPWYNSEHNFSNTSAHWGNDFNHESIYTQNFIDSVNSYWMSEYRFDGFRFDFTKGFSNTYHGDNDPWGSNYDAARISILKRMADEIWARNENAIVIFEHLSVNSEEKVLANHGVLMWGNANNDYAEASMAFNDNGNSDFSWISYQKRGWNDPHVVGYMESHDEERIMFKNYTWGRELGNYSIQDTSTALDRIRLVNALFYTIPGPKMLWQFGELGYDYSIDYNGRLGEKPVRWDYYDDWRRRYNHDFISSLIKLKTTEDVFETDDFELDLYDALKAVKLFHSSMNLVAIGNFDLLPGEISPGFPHAGEWYEYFTGDTLVVNSLSMNIPLLQGEYRIYTDVKLESPGIGTGIDDSRAGVGPFKGYIYPNPSHSKSWLRISPAAAVQALSVDVYDLAGARVAGIPARDYPSGEHIIALPLTSLAPGIYFCVISSGQGREALRIIKY